ncbi:MAG: manganese efflux pump [Spirochaetales bacterium]|nr:manganese efflux pump [Spirochaetales bacterium]
MQWSFVFFFNSILLGIGLAMDAFSVSLANGLNEPEMKTGRMNLIAGTYSFFQFAMPMIGWICIRTVVEYFQAFEKYVPWIALALLAYIGGEMLIKGIRKKESAEAEDRNNLGFGKLLVQGIATSIDALSVGFTIEQYEFPMALVASLIIAFVTHFICLGGLAIGKKAGVRLADKASILGGLILIGIGLEILIRSFF